MDICFWRGYLNIPKKYNFNKIKYLPFANYKNTKDKILPFILFNSSFPFILTQKMAKKKRPPCDKLASNIFWFPLRPKI